jgi:hypothetical protein
MKKILLYAMSLVVLFLFLLTPGCNKNDDNQNTFTGYTETLYTNPADNQICSIDSAGYQMTIMGTKDVNGLPTAITQALIDAPDKNPQNRMLMDFNTDGTLSQISNPNLGYMNFNYVNDTTIVIKLTLSNNLGLYQISYNPKKHTKSLGGCGCSKNISPVKGPMRPETVPVKKNIASAWTGGRHVLPNRPKSGNVKGNITAIYDQGGEYVTGLTLSAQYITSNGKRGVVPIQQGSQDGVFTYYLPDNPAPPPPSGFSDKVQYLLNALCWGNAPKNITREGICGYFTMGDTPDPGSMLCNTMLGAYLFICQASTATKVSQDVFDLYTASSITITIAAQSPILASQTKTVQFIPSTGVLSDVQFTFSGAATFSRVYTDPESPEAKEGYIINALLTQTGSSETVTVRLSMIGSDGYTKSDDFQVVAGGSCQLSIPGGAQGVRDDITAQIITGANPLPGQKVMLHLIFQ